MKHQAFKKGKPMTKIKRHVELDVCNNTFTAPEDGTYSIGYSLFTKTVKLKEGDGIDFEILDVSEAKK